MKQRIVGLILFLILCLLVNGCCEQVSVFPAGAYVATASGQDIILDFASDGSYSAVLAGRALLTEGRYRCAGNVITFAADMVCRDEATYEWMLENHTLTFEVKGRDQCPERLRRLQDTVYTCVTCS